MQIFLQLYTNCLVSCFHLSWPPFSFKVYFSSKLNIIDACVVIVTLVVTMVYTFSDLSGPSLIPRYMFAHCIPITTDIQ